MKLALFLPSLDGRGAEKVVVNLLRHLDRDKFKLKLFLVEKKGPYLHYLPDDVEVVNLDSKRVLFSIPKLIQSTNEYQPDIIFSTIGHLNLAILLSKPFFKGNPKLYFREANMRSKNPGEQFNLKKSLMRLLYKVLYPKVDKLILQCEEMQKEFSMFLNIEKSKLTYIYNPVDIDHINSMMKTENPYNKGSINFVASGKMIYQKGFDVLLEAFSEVLKSESNSRLTILGEGPLKDKLQNRAFELGIEGSVDFVGFIENPYPYYYYADTFVLSSRWEGFPNVILEALACNTTVVATNCKTGPKEIIGDNEYGILVKVDDKDELAKGMLTSLRKNFPSYKRAKCFSADKITKIYESFFEGDECFEKE